MSNRFLTLLRCSLRGASLLLFAPTLARAYYPNGPYAVFQPVDSLPPTGAALGPWRWNFNFGGGPTPVLGPAKNQLSNGWNWTVGTGYNFTPRWGLDLEFMDSELAVTDSALQRNQASSGDATIWAVTLDPIWRFRIGGPVGGYLIGGGGLYERVTRFDEPVVLFVPTFRGGFDLPAIETVRQTDDNGGLNVGAGLTCNLGWGTKLFMEVRYHYIFTSGTPTQIIPVTFGFRW